MLTQVVTENKQLIARRHFLIRALANRNISKTAYDEEMPGLDAQIMKNLTARLEKSAEAMRIDLAKVKEITVSDGDLKRGVAKLLIEFLRKDFDEDEIKGVFRQGYKALRGMT